MPHGGLTLPAPPHAVADLVAQVAAALHYLHAHGLVHGAVGSASVLLHAQPDGRWRALLADADLPSVAEATAPGSAGTAPTPADDQAALAALAYLLLAGRAPAAPQPPAATAAESAATEAATPDHAAALRAANPAVPAAAARAIARALAPDPAARFSSVAAFAESVAQALPAADRDAWASSPETSPRVTTPVAPPSVPNTSLPVPARQGLEPERARPAPPPRRTRPVPRAARAGDLAGRGPAVDHPPDARPHRWRRAALGLGALALLLGALVLALRLPDSNVGPVTASGQTGGGKGAGQQVGVAGSQLTIAGGNTASTATIAAAAPPATPVGQSDRAILIARPAAVSVAPGQPFAASFTLLNSGASTWSAADGYGLVCDHARHPDASCASTMWIGFGPYAIAPGQQVKFTVDLIAPADPGTYVLWWNLAHAGQVFDSPDVALRVIVAPPLQPTAPPTLTPGASPSATPSGTPDPSPTVSPTASPTPTPTTEPSATPATPPTMPLTPIVTPPAALPPLG
jgi:hypothetical protein